MRHLRSLVTTATLVGRLGPAAFLGYVRVVRTLVEARAWRVPPR